MEGAPLLTIRIGDQTRFASFLPWDGDEWPPQRLQFQHQFVYDVQPGDHDEDGISIGADAFDFAEGKFLNEEGATIEVEIHSVGPREDHFVEPGRDLEEHRVVGVAPPPPVLQARVSVYSIPSPYSGLYTEGMWIRLIAALEEPVRVKGSPRLEIDIGGATRHADFAPYEFGHRYSTPEHRARDDYLPRFDYLVRADDMDADGFRIGMDAFDFTEGALLNEAGVEVEVKIYSVTPDESDDGLAEPGWDLGSHPVDGIARQRRCTDERTRARGGAPILVDEWVGAPFIFYFDLAGLPDHMRAEADRVLEAAQRLSDRIEDQIGYSLFEVGGPLDDAKVGDPYDADCGGREPGQIIGVYQADGPARANRRCATWGGGLDFGAGTVSHELFHLFGFEHHPESWRNPGQYDRGVFMSNRLNGVYVDEEDHGVAFEDVDALRCIFPEGG